MLALQLGQRPLQKSESPAAFENRLGGKIVGRFERISGFRVAGLQRKANDDGVRWSNRKSRSQNIRRRRELDRQSLGIGALRNLSGCNARRTKIRGRSN